MPQSKCRGKRKSWLTSAQQREKIAPHEWRRIILIGLLACSLMMCCACSPAVKIVKFMPPDSLLDDCEPVVPRQIKTNADLVNLVIDLYAALDDCNADKQALRAYRRSLDMDHGQK